jgi:hypothetical protein
MSEVDAAGATKEKCIMDTKKKGRGRPRKTAAERNVHCIICHEKLTEENQILRKSGKQAGYPCSVCKKCSVPVAYRQKWKYTDETIIQKEIDRLEERKHILKKILSDRK